jgi:ABC-type cobalamin/Fe3+-siderophores transport system ATPase subunit
MISELLLKSGAAPGVAAAPISITPVTIFVGPNNSGKSKVLTEIERYASSGLASVGDLIVDHIRFRGLSADEANIVVSGLVSPPNAGETQSVGHIFIQGRRSGRAQIRKDQFLKSIQDPSSQPDIFGSWFLRNFVLKLDGPNRVALINQQPAGDLQSPPLNSLQTLFQNGPKRKEVRRILREAFGSYFVIDPTSLGQLRIRLSQREPINEMEERNIHEEGVAFHSQAIRIDYTSDGVKAFTGIIMELIAGDPRILLIDEPEAFLHPSLATKLGYEIARAAAESDKRVFASTHSPQFVMGCIQSGTPINIVRLTYRSGVPTSRVLPSAEILELMRNPLLRSTGVLNGLFYEHVIVTESDADRAFYQEINERLLRYSPEWGIPNCLFLNSQGKHTLQTIMQPLRKLGIPAAGIVDIDVLKDSGAQWSGIMDGANVPQTSRQSFAILRASIKSAMDATQLSMKKDGGIAVLKGDPRQAAEDLLKQMSDYGMFVVPGGELESWLKELAASGHGPPWLINIFTKMGNDPASPSYVKPTDNDVWAFMSKVKAWLIDPNRRGIPS